ncbi:MAG TPA: class I SAM-dependent methyltransferase [Candidatus Melainabacteria bacterium]|nr:class I SAM-dependent methyltransferase [Candidatus Melainabacteria bacterium]
MKPTKEDVSRQFGKNAENYAQSAGHARGVDLEIVFNMLTPNRRWHVLDIATGAGHTAAMVAPSVARVTAIDLAPEMIEQTLKLFEKKGIENGEARVMDVEDLSPFEDESFDAVTCRIAPHHFLDIEKAVAEIARVLRPRGVFVLEDSLSPEDVALDRFINEVEKLRDPTHVRAYNESEWREMLRLVGFKIKKTRNYRKTHEIQDWMDKASLAADQQPQVLDAFRSADEAARLEFEIKFEGDLPVSYTDNKIILRAVKA